MYNFLNTSRHKFNMFEQLLLCTMLQFVINQENSTAYTNVIIQTRGLCKPMYVYYTYMGANSTK